MRGEGAGDRLARLMHAAQDGDTDAYAQLLEELAVRLRGIIRRYARALSREDIEDLVQDVLLSVHVVRATYDSRRPFMPWLLAITRNRVADRARRHARGAAHEVIVDDLAVTFSDSGTNLEGEGEYGDPEALRQAIQALPKAQRIAIDMLKLREMSLKAAAAATGTSIAALKVSTHRATRALRKMLTKE